MLNCIVVAAALVVSSALDIALENVQSRRPERSARR